MSTMNPAAAGGVPYRVPPEPSRLPSIVLAAVVHAGLLLFLAIGINWQSTEPVAVEAEVWDMSTRAAAPPPEPVPEVAPPPPAPVPVPRVVEPPVERPAAPTPPDISLEREKKRKAELEKKLQEQKVAEEKREKKELEEQKRQELAEKKALEKAEKLAKAKKAAAEQKKIEDARAKEMARITGAVGNTGTAAKSTAPRSDPGYLASITSKIKSSTSYLGATDVPGNPRAVFRIEELPTGEIISVKMIKSSGVPLFDDAVEKGINKSSPLPKKKDGTVERILEIGFSMKDLN